LHRCTSFCDQAQPVLEVERSRSDKSRVLPDGTIPTRSAASSTIKLWTKVASWALSVLVKVS
jgi:hypothetical protein